MVRGIDLFFSLFNNLAIFIALVGLHGYLLHKSSTVNKSSASLQRVVTGLTFGAFAIGCMYAKIPVFEGVIVDQRNAIVALSALYGGPLAGFISILMAGTFRVYLGGGGVFAGLVGLHLAAIAGVLLRAIPSPFSHLKTGSISALFATLLILPGFLFVNDFATGFALLKAMALPYGVAIYCGILLGGLLLHRTENHVDAEKRLEHSERQFRTLVDTIPDPIWLKDNDGVFITCNSTFEKLFDKPRSEIIGKTDYDFFEPEVADFFRDYDAKAMAAGQPISNEEWVQFNATGTRALLNTTKTPMLDANGKFVGVLGIGRDITEVRRAEEVRLKLESQLRETQKIESIGVLAGGVAHDFNNMLGAIIGHAELALMRKDQTERVIEHLGEILKAAKRSSELTTQLMTFARKQTVAPVMLKLDEAIDGIKNMLKSLTGENIQLVFENAPDLWLVKIDPNQVDQMLVNLCINARDAIADQGQITISTANIALTANDLPADQNRPPGDYIRLNVTDTGCGIDAATQKRIFEPFFTTKDVGKGTGLGLSAVYGAITQHQGFIKVDSAPGKGTTFSIFLPRATGGNGGVQKQEEIQTKKTSPGNETILLVEDEDILLVMTQTILENGGYQVLGTNSPQEALSIVRNHPDKIDLLISDIMMPTMNGRELAEQIIQIRHNLKVLFMSGYSQDIISSNGVIETGINFIQKPVSMKKLISKVQEILAQND